MGLVGLLKQETSWHLGNHPSEGKTHLGDKYPTRATSAMDNDPPQIIPFTISQQWEQVWTNSLCFSLCFPFLSLLLPFGSPPKMFLSTSM